MQHGQINLASGSGRQPQQWPRRLRDHLQPLLDDALNATRHNRRWQGDPPDPFEITSGIGKGAHRLHQKEDIAFGFTLKKLHDLFALPDLAKH